jgi:hypothetical protein
MLKKVLILKQFGRPFGWEEQLFDNFQHLKEYGWDLFVFTSNEMKSRGNVKIIPMTLEEFDKLIIEKTGIDPHNYIDPQTGNPHKVPSDYYPAEGLIFEDYIKGYDFWGHINWDVTFGRLDHWIPDSFLEEIDIFGNDPDAINGVFTVYRNNKFINNLFREHPQWQEVFATHYLYNFDEIHFSETVRKARDGGRVRFKSAWWMSNDRQPQHTPIPQIETDKDHTLYELKDGKRVEIMLFHWNRVKQWPLK